MELHQKVDVLRRQLGYDESLPLHEMVEKAIGDAGVECEGMTLVQQVDACLSALGVNPANIPTAPVVAVSGWFGQPPAVQMAVPLGMPPQSVPMATVIDVAAVEPQVVAPKPMVTKQLVNAPISFLPVSEYDEVWDDRGSGAKQDVSVWKARVPGGCFLLGMTAKNGHSRPTFPTLVIQNPQAGQIAPPDRYELAWWQERGQRRFWCWHPIPPPGYASLGDVGTLSAEPPSREEVMCVAIASLPGVKQPLGAQIWNDRNGGAPKDGAFWAQPGGTGLFRCNDDATHRRPAGDFYLPTGSRGDAAAPPPPEPAACCVIS